LQEDGREGADDLELCAVQSQVRRADPPQLMSVGHQCEAIGDGL